MVIDKIPQFKSDINKDPIWKLFSGIPDDSELGTALFEEVTTDPTKVALGDPISPLYIGRLRATEALDEPTIDIGRVGREVATRRETGRTLQFKSGPNISLTKMPS